MSEKAHHLTDLQALELIKAGLQSGSIKLNGTRNAVDTQAATKEAEADAAYLRTLLEKISNGPRSAPSVRP